MDLEAGPDLGAVLDWRPPERSAIGEWAGGAGLPKLPRDRDGPSAAWSIPSAQVAGMAAGVPAGGCRGNRAPAAAAAAG
jgi:hypothetical protein